jgi:hypothetical protein
MESKLASADVLDSVDHSFAQDGILHVADLRHVLTEAIAIP